MYRTEHTHINIQQLNIAILFLTTYQAINNMFA